jgi:hypothetical protein
MKLGTQNIGVILAVLVVISAGATLALTSSLDNSKPSTEIAGMFMYQNVKVTQTDEFGNIIAVKQGDNHIVQNGLIILTSQLFNGLNETLDIPTHPISHIEIGTDGEWRVLHNNTDIYAPIGGLCVRQPIIAANTTSLPPLLLDLGEEGSPGSCDDTVGNECAAQFNVTATATFAGNDCNPGVSIDEAGIYDNVSDLMFARNTFGGVVLNPGDSLALDWEFTFTDKLP